MLNCDLYNKLVMNMLLNFVFFDLCKKMSFKCQKALLIG